MINVIPPHDSANTEKYPMIVTFDKGTVWLKRRGRPARKVTVWVWAAIATTFLVLFNPF